jgi:hypothetical protein
MNSARQLYVSLMLGDDLAVASERRRDGYEDPSHFSRDYKTLWRPAAPRHRSASW